jgi:hypothetical protein
MHLLRSGALLAVQASLPSRDRKPHGKRGAVLFGGKSSIQGELQNFPQSNNGFQSINTILNRYYLLVTDLYIHRTCGIHVDYFAEYIH